MMGGDGLAIGEAYYPPLETDVRQGNGIPSDLERKLAADLGAPGW